MAENPDPTPAAAPTASPDPPASPPAGGDPSAADPPASPPPAAFEGVIDGEGKFVEGFSQKAPESIRKAVEGIEKAGTPDVWNLMTRYHSAQQELHKLTGGADYVVIPGEDAPEEAQAAYRNKLGVPNSPAEYGIAAPEELPEGVNWNQEEYDSIAERLFAKNAPKEVVEEIMAIEMERKAAEAESRAQEDVQRAEELTTKLQQEWGADYPRNVRAGHEMAALLGYDPGGDAERFNNPLVVELLHRFTKFSHESRLGNAGFTPSAGASVDQAVSNMHARSGGGQFERDHDIYYGKGEYANMPASNPTRKAVIDKYQNLSHQLEADKRRMASQGG